MAKTKTDSDQRELEEKHERHGAGQPYATEVDDRLEESKRQRAPAQPVDKPPVNRSPK